MKIFTLKRTKIILILLLLISILGSLAPLFGLNIQIYPVIEKIQLNNKENKELHNTLFKLLKISKTADKIYHSISTNKQDLKLWNEQVIDFRNDIKNDKIKKLFDTETLYFHHAFQLSNEIGKESYGHIGNARMKIHEIENSIKSNQHKMIQLLELRRREKDYLLRQDIKHLNKFKQSLHDLRKVLTKRSNLELLNQYDEEFTRVNIKMVQKKDFFYKANNISNQILYKLEKLIKINKNSQADIIELIDDFKLKLTYIIIVAIFFIVIAIIYLFRVVQVENDKKQELLENVKKKLDENIRLQEKIVAQEKLSSLGVLSAGIAHEVRNPLNIISGSAQNIDLILEDLKDSHPSFNPEVLQELESLKECSSLILNSSARANSIVRNMLSMSSQSKRPKEYFNVAQVVEESYALAYHSMRASHPFELQADLTLDQCELEAIKSDFIRVMINIIENSFYAMKEKLDHKSSEDNGYHPKIRIDLKKEEMTIELTIEDNGIGISPKDKEKILEPFFTTKPAGQGVGLGMHFVYDFITSHGGSLEIESEVQNYTRIIISLPN